MLMKGENPDKKRSRGWLILTSVLIASGINIETVWPQQAATVSNTANANFGDPFNPTDPLTDTTSNTVPLSAVLGEAVLELIKTGDRAAAEPGDTVIYRLLVRNTGTVSVSNITLTDQLPLGMQLLPNSIQGAITVGTTATPTSIALGSQSGQTATFQYNGVLGPSQDLTVIYAVQLTPDALRGNGRNLATAAGQTPSRTIQSGTASHVLRINSGILTDCGTLLGRVFIDHNFDGEQQAGEAGIPNAVIFLDNGNRITTDIDGAFSVTCLLPGARTGTLDLTSVPGYVLAPNLYRIQDNSQSRLVHMAPGSLERMNFAVTASQGEIQQP